MKDHTYIVTMRTIYPHFGLCARDSEIEATDEQLGEHLELRFNSHPVALTAGEGTRSASLYDWHWRMGHRSMKTIISMAKGAATGVILKDLLSDIPKLDSCPSCTLMKAKRLPFKAG